MLTLENFYGFMRCHLDEEGRAVIGVKAQAAAVRAEVAAVEEAVEAVLAVPQEVILEPRQEEVAIPIKAQEAVEELIVPAPAEHKIDQEKQVA